jgi:hypothetical protein
MHMARKAVGKGRDFRGTPYDSDENLRLALIQLVQVISEAARQVSRELTAASHPEIPWDNIVGMRLPGNWAPVTSGRRQSTGAAARARNVQGSLLGDHCGGEGAYLLKYVSLV